MKKKKKSRVKKNRILIVVLILVACLGFIYYKTRNTLQVVSVVSEIDDYNYKLESNATRIYKKYYKELESELEDNKIDEEYYAELISKLFVIDYYTLNNKITNKNIGGVQFIYSDVQDSFINSASTTVYKYVKNNLYGNRKQKLPEVNSVEVTSIENIIYDNDTYHDDSAYKVTVKVGYVKDYDYPEEVILTLIHEDIKLSIIEIE